MKKSVLGICFVVMGIGVAAQNNSSPAVNLSTHIRQVSTSNDIRQLANQLQLNEGQYIRLRDLSKVRQEQHTEINTMYSNDPAMRQTKVREAQKQFDTQLAQSVTAKQFTAYQQLQGRHPAASGSSLQAGGYGGQSLESNTNSPQLQSPSPVSQEENGNADNKAVRVNQNAVKIENQEGEMKVKAIKEKAETAELKYKADRDEVKLKTKDGTIKAKSEKGKTKLETPQGKMKLKDGEVQVKPRRGSQP